MVNDPIADSIFQQLQTRPDEYSIPRYDEFKWGLFSDAAAIDGGLGMGPWG